MQLVGIVAILPSAFLLSRTRGYSWFRIAGASFGGAAAAGWMAERVVNVRGPVDFAVDTVAQRILWIAGGLFVASMAYRWLHRTEPSGLELQESSEL